MHRRHAVAVATLIILVVFLVAACGGGDDGEAAPPPAQPAETAPADGAGGSTTLAIAADPSGALAFDTASLEVPAGSITIDLTNESDVPHNVTIEGVENGATDTITGSSASVTVELEPGTYTFFCSVPGHRQGGMEGTLTVS